MGAGLVKAAYAVGAVCSIDHAPMRVFVYMALVAVDSDPEPRYWGGYDDLAVAMGKSGPAGHRAAGRALSALSTAGLIQSSGAAPGRNSRYRLLDGNAVPLRPLANRATPDAHRPANVGRSASDEAVDNSRTPDAHLSNAGRSPVATPDAHRPTEEEAGELGGGKPSRYCANHPNGTAQPCGPCRDARLADDARSQGSKQDIPRTPRPPKPGECAHASVHSRRCDACGQLVEGAA